MRVLCVGRHPYLSDHLCRFLDSLGVETQPAVGLEQAADRATAYRPDAVVCDYDLLATLPLDRWEQDPLLSRLPLIAVSLTRRPEDEQPLDINGIGGLLYLPTLDRNDALRLLAAVASARGVSAPVSLPWPAPAPQHR
jgi:DNA-binding NarL/FixJ family response regulator